MSIKKKTDKVSIGWRGNKKMSWPTFNLPAVKTCPQSTPECRRTCYALKAENVYPQVLPCRMGNLEITRQDWFVNDVHGQLAAKRKRPEIFRIHESGDFYSLDYFQNWCEIAELNPDITFFAFTKVFDLFKEIRPANFTLIASVYTDETRPVPEGAPSFETVAKGDTAEGIKCHGYCDSCGVCPFAADGTKVWAEVH